MAFCLDRVVPWGRNMDELENVRMSAMQLFLADYERGKEEKRYICHELPEKIALYG